MYIKWEYQPAAPERSPIFRALDMSAMMVQPAFVVCAARALAELETAPNAEVCFAFDNIICKVSYSGSEPQRVPLPAAAKYLSGVIAEARAWARLVRIPAYVYQDTRGNFLYGCAVLADDPYIIIMPDDTSAIGCDNCESEARARALVRPEQEYEKIEILTSDLWREHFKRPFLPPDPATIRHLVSIGQLKLSDEQEIDSIEEGGHVRARTIQYKATDANGIQFPVWAMETYAGIGTVFWFNQKPAELIRHGVYMTAGEVHVPRD